MLYILYILYINYILYTLYIDYILYTLYILHIILYNFTYYFLSYNLIGSIISYTISTNFLNSALSNYNTYFIRSITLTSSPPFSSLKIPYIFRLLVTALAENGRLQRKIVIVDVMVDAELT